MMAKIKRFTEIRNGKHVIPLRNAVCGVDLPHWCLSTSSDNEQFLSGDAANKLAQYEEEKEQREQGCEYCDFSSGDVGANICNTGDGFVLVKSDEGVSIATDDVHFRMLKINCCPMCGRRLEEKE